MSPIRLSPVQAVRFWVAVPLIALGEVLATATAACDHLAERAIGWRDV